jgi:hypothetical protein
MVFKSLDPSDISLRTFKVFKNWSCDHTTTTSLGIVIQDGVKDNSLFQLGDSQNADGSYKKLIWASAKHCYYTTGSYIQYNALYNFVNPDKIYNISRSIDDGIRILNIPINTFGLEIKPNSILIETGSTKIIDDGNYNLYVSGSDPRTIIGNVFYQTGQLLITSQSYTSSLDVFDFSFQSTVEIKEYEVVCSVLEGEFNYTTNLSAYETNSLDYIPIFSSSLYKPLITTIGLYNDNNELVMVGKLGRPFKREYDLDTTFVLRIDL